MVPVKIGRRHNMKIQQPNSGKCEKGCEIPSYASRMHPYHTHGSKPHKRLGVGEKYRRSFIVMMIHASDLSFFPAFTNDRLTSLRR